MFALCLLCNIFIQFVCLFIKIVRKLIDFVTIAHRDHNELVAYIGFWSTHHSRFCSKKMVAEQKQSLWEEEPW